MSRSAPELRRYATEVRRGSVTWLARAITLVESTRPEHRRQAEQLLVELGDHAGAGAAAGTVRLGVSGVPGAGKSTLIDALGSRLTGAGHKVAVLAVDPSSTRTGGSILGDKTRMARLANDPNAFIRPSPTAGTLGGVTRSTRESIVLVEAAGFDVVIVETVGVGQSETAVAGMVDTFLLLTLGRTGDQLQGIKRGVLELADVIAVNKADGEHQTEARRAARELAGALRLTGAAEGAGWRPRVLTCSALEGTGLDELWATVQAHRKALAETGLADRRRDQLIDWTRALVRDAVLDRFRADPRLRALTGQLEAQVLAGELTPVLAADRILAAWQPVPADAHQSANPSG